MKTAIGSHDNYAEVTWHTTPVRYLDAFLDYRKRLARNLGVEISLKGIFQDLVYTDLYIFFYELRNQPGELYLVHVDKYDTKVFYFERARKLAQA